MMVKTLLLATFLFTCSAVHSQPPKTAFFTKLGKEINTAIPSIGSFIVCSNDSIQYEGYFHQATRATVFNVKSVTKTMVSALAGIAKQKDLLPDLDTPVLSILKEYATPRSQGDVWFSSDMAYYDSVRATITIKHLLTMQAGFDWDDFGAVAAALILSSDPVRLSLDIRMENDPGTRFNYNTGVSIIFGALLARCVKADLKSFAEENLFKPAGMSLKGWSTDPMGRYIGGSEMEFTATDLLKFGQLYLHQGKAGDRQVVPSDWVKESTSEQAVLNSWPVLPGANGYGYYWWRRKTNGHQAYVASGYGGQLVCVVPDLKLVIATTCFLNDRNRGREEIKRLHVFIDKVTNYLK